MIKIGFNDLPNYEGLTAFDQSRQGVLYKHLKDAKKIDDNIWFKKATRKKFSHWIEMRHYHNDLKAEYINSLVPKLLKEGAIYESLDKIAEGVVNRSQSNGGSTTYTSTGLAAAVAIKNSPEQKVPELTKEVVIKYIEDNYDSFLKHEGNFLGTWYNDGLWYLDVSEVLVGKNKKEEALRLGKERGQKAIYDLYQGEELFVDYSEDTNKTPEENAEQTLETPKDVETSASFKDLMSLSNKLFKK